jgi:hypothetical protein
VYGGGVVDGIGFGFHCLLLEKLHEEGNMVSASVGSATGCRGVVGLPNATGPGKFMEHVGDAGGVVYIIVGIPMADCLKPRAKFSAPIFAGGKRNVGKENESNLSVIDGDA